MHTAPTQKLVECKATVINQYCATGMVHLLPDKTKDFIDRFYRCNYLDEVQADEICLLFQSLEVMEILPIKDLFSSNFRYFGRWERKKMTCHCVQFSYQLISAFNSCKSIPDGPHWLWCSVLNAYLIILTRL